jgi:outer membrane protein OmpA-like peptidoglycan-associated protein
MIFNCSQAEPQRTCYFSAATSDPPFLRRSIQFGPESLEPTFAARTLLRRAADWLRQHREARILIVGSCDSGGSEPCTHALAEARGTVVEKFLESSGIDPDQIVGVKGWDNFAQSCRPSHIGCQQINRSARIFVAGSVAP